MRETITFDHHAEHAWSHFAIRLVIVLLTLFLILVLFGDSLGQDKRAILTSEDPPLIRPLCEARH